MLGLAGYSGSGKTTLLEKIIPLLVAQGAGLSVIKHAHHDFDIDQPGKDSYRQRKAGANEVLIASNRRWALMHESIDEAEPELEELVARLSPCHLILIEGYKQASIPKLEVHRCVTGQPFLHPSDASIIAVATDSKQHLLLPVLDINAPQQIANFIMDNFLTEVMHEN